MNSNSNDITLTDVITSKQDNIHMQMYDEALSYYMSYAGISEEDYRFVEIKSAYYDSPSHVQVIAKTWPYRRITVDLAPFWNPYKFSDKLSYMKVDDDDTVLTAEVIYRDYVRGQATLRSRYTGRSLKVAIKDLPDDIKDIDDEKSLSHTFAYKVNNKIYGKD